MRKILIALAVLNLAAGTAFAGKLVVDAFETHSSLFHLPEFESGTTQFQRCGHCTYTVVKATAATVYEYGGYRVTLSELRKAVADRPAALAVLYRVEDNTLVRISAY